MTTARPAKIVGELVDFADASLRQISRRTNALQRTTAQYRQGDVADRIERYSTGEDLRSARDRTYRYFGRPANICLQATVRQ